MPTQSKGKSVHGAASSRHIESLEGRTLFNGSFLTASDVGTVETQQTFADSVSVSTDTDDYRLFRLTHPGALTITLSGLNSDADLYLYDANYNELGRSRLGGTATDTISKSYILEGSYYVRVQAYSGSTGYTLGLNFQAQDNTTGTARYIVDPALQTSTSYNFVGDADTQDYFRFDAAPYSNYRITLSGLSADADVQLVTGGGQVLATSNRGGTSNDTIDYFHPYDVNGSIFVRVYQYSGNTNYTLTVQGWTDLAGNSLAAAYDLGQVSGSRTLREFVGSRDNYPSAAADPVDYVRLNVFYGATINASISGLTADADLDLLDSNGNVLRSSTFGGTATDSVSFTSYGGGTYYLRIRQYSGNTPYLLNVSA